MKLAQANQLIDWWTLDTKPAVEHSYRSAFIMSTFGGLVASGAFHPAHLWPLLFVGIGLLFKLNEEGTTSERIFVNLIFGFSFQLFSFIWLGADIDSWTWFAEFFLQTLFFLVLSFTEGAMAFATSWLLLEFVSRSFPFEQFEWKRLGQALNGSHLDFLIPVLGAFGMTFVFVLIIGWVVNYKISGILMATALLLFLTLMPINITEFGNMNMIFEVGSKTAKKSYEFQYSGRSVFALWLFFLSKTRRAFRG